MTTTALTEPQIVAGLTQPGFRLGIGQFTFSIPTVGSAWPGYAAGSEPFSPSYGLLTAAQATAFRSTIAQWDTLIAPNFTEVTETPSTRGEIRVAFTAMGSGTAGYAYSGTPQPAGGKVGDIWLNAANSGDDYSSGTYEFSVLLHEIGHTLGLKHSFEGTPLPEPYENLRYTIMSYDEAPAGVVTTFVASGGGIRSVSEYVVAVTPMVADIAAVQSIYGADPTTRSSDTTYRFNQSQPVLQAIYDAGGNDTIDLSNFSRGNDVDLRPGAYSSIGKFSLEEQIAYWTAQFPQFGTFIRNVLSGQDIFVHSNNLGIAFSSIIENAIGGTAADTIIGNDVSNRLSGGGGNDRLEGGAGNDFLVGGAGADVLIGGEGIDTALYNDGFGAVSINLTLGRGYGNAAEADTLSSIENVVGSVFGDIIIGDGLGNRLDGDAGDDVLIGALGADLLVGGSGFDTASYEDNQGSVFVDLLRGSGYNNSAEGDAFDGIENLRGSIFADYLIGSNEANRLEGGAGDDVLIGALGADILAGGDGSDTASFEDNQGAVFINLSLGKGFGNAAEGDAYSSIENLIGSVFYDTFIGDAAANRLDGARGADTLTGAGGADVFAFTTALDGAINVDTITDFLSGVDRIELGRAIFSTLVPGVLGTSAFVVGAGATSAAHRIVYDAATGALRYDADGSGAGASVLFAMLENKPVIAASDFFVA